MLVLTRRYGEKITLEIGQKKVEITLLERGYGKQAAIGIDADKDVNIYRNELKQPKETIDL